MKKYLIDEEELIKFINVDNNSEYTTEHNVGVFLACKQEVEEIVRGKVAELNLDKKYYMIGLGGSLDDVLENYVGQYIEVFIRTRPHECAETEVKITKSINFNEVVK